MKDIVSDLGLPELPAFKIKGSGINCTGMQEANKDAPTVTGRRRRGITCLLVGLLWKAVTMHNPLPDDLASIAVDADQ